MGRLTSSDEEGSDPAALPLEDLVDRAWRLGCTIDLPGIGYGRTHWGSGGDVLTAPFPYYHFLAGLVRLIEARRVVEVGTHHGGSARAMAVGMANSPEAKIVTFDIAPDGSEILARHPIIRAYHLDALSETAFEVCVAEFGGASVDFAYIDAAHDFWPTLQSFLICSGGLGARIVVLDDIALNPEMGKLWRHLRRSYPGDTIDATDIHPEIRGGRIGMSPGFGVVRTRVACG